MKELMMLYGVILGRRYTKKQKNYFFRELKKDFSEAGFPVVFQKDNSIENGGNIIAGDIHKAKAIFAAAYDTPAKAFLPGYRYYPFHMEKNLRQERTNMLVQTLLGVILALGAYIFLKKYLEAETFGRTAYLLSAVICSAGTLLVYGSRANKVNFNRNSAALAVMAKIATNKKGDTNIAFVFFDKTVSSYDGIKEFTKEYPMDGKTFLLLDSIAYGEKLVVAHREKGIQTAAKLVELAKNQNLCLLDKLYDSDKADQNVLALDNSMLYLVSGTVQNKEFIVFNTKSHKDLQVDIKRLEAITDMCIKLTLIEKGEG